MKNKLFSAGSISLMIISLFLVLTVNVSAQRKGKKEVVVKKDNQYREVIVKDRHYFYHEGYFYEKRPAGYVKIVAPAGARITLLPHGYKVAIVHKRRYYVFGGIYYRYVPREKVYIVVNMHK